MKKKQLIIITIVTIIMIAIVCFAGLKSKQANNKDKKIEKYTITSSEKVFIDGKISPEISKDFYLDASKGVVDKVKVSNGQIVKKGDVLFTYKNDQIDVQIEQVKNQVKTIEVQKNQSGLISGSEKSSIIDTKSINNQISELKNQINSLEKKKYIDIVADFDGKAYVGNSEPDKNAPILTLKTTTFYIKGKISEKDQPKIKAGDPVNIFIISLKKSVTGKINFVGDRPVTSDIAAAANAQAQGNISYYDVNITCDNQQNLTDGFHVQAICKLSSEPIKIPNTSVIKNGKDSFVYRVVEKKLKRQFVTVEKSENGYSIIKSGLAENDVIVKNAAASLKEGQLIE